MIKTRCEERILPYGRDEIVIRIDRPNRESDVVLVLGHGYYNDMEDDLLQYLAQKLPEEGLLVVRFNYPFAHKRWKGFPHASKWVPLYRKVLERIQAEPFIPENAYYFTGGKSISSLVSASLPDHLDTGKIFLGAPLEFRKGFLRWPVNPEPFLNQSVPMLFVQGREDIYAPPRKVELLMGKLNPRGHLLLIPGADHSLKIQNQQNRSQKEVYQEISDIILWFVSESLSKKLEKQKTGKNTEKSSNHQQM
jgi:predicted alpha/beta-hydrolase family hydrolase